MMKSILLVAFAFVSAYAETPALPSHLQLIPTIDAVTVSWQDNSSNETGFKIYRDDKLVGFTLANETSYHDRLLTPLTTYNYTVKATDDVILDSKQRRIVDGFVSIFENSTQEIQYAYAEDIEDDRGITAGRAGFTSATGDMLAVIKRYGEAKPHNSLQVYIQRLEELAAIYAANNYEVNAESASTVGLEGLVLAWRENALLEEFRDVQDRMVDELYYYPALEKAYAVGMKFPLSLLSFYDTAIQHGESGLEEIITEATARTGGQTPTMGADEVTWLTNFNTYRKEVLEADEDWSSSVVRVVALEDMIEAQNYQLDDFRMVIHAYGDEEHYLPSRVYESAEDLTTIGWHYYGSSPENATVSNLYDAGQYGRIISFTNLTQEDAYLLGSWNDTGLSWHNSEDRILEWKLKYSEDFTIMMDTQTSFGRRLLVYTPEDTSRGFYDSYHIHHGLGTSANDGSWRYFSRNLEEDLQAFEVDNSLLWVNGFLIQGAGRVDDLMMH